MFQRELSQTLIELIASVQPPPDSGLVVTEAEVDLPLETGVATRGNDLIFLGSVPHSRWQAGFLPPVTMARIHVVSDNDEQTF
ncbi:MAG: hypothetical protein H7070_13500 [Saprospiraceae bacterium]|nr:hypothetical protein [Pyrinomonadaceae bacterium]